MVIFLSVGQESRYFREVVRNICKNRRFEGEDAPGTGKDLNDLILHHLQRDECLLRRLMVVMTPRTTSTPDSKRLVCPTNPRP